MLIQALRPGRTLATRGWRGKMDHMMNLVILAASACLLALAPCPAQAQNQPAKQSPAKKESPLSRADSILLSKVEFNDLRLDKVAAELTALSAKADPAGGVKVAYAGPAKDIPSFSITMNGVSLGQLLKILTQSVGYRASAKDGVILLEPR